MAFEFHVSRASRDHYEFDRALFQTSGNVIVPNFPAARAFARRMNERADPARYPGRVVHAAELNAMGLIDEICHHAVEIYRRTVNPQAMADAIAALKEHMGADRLDHALLHFVDQFPPLAVYRDGRSPADYLAGASEGVPNREIALEELLMLWLANANPAFMTYEELFDDASLTEKTDYERLVAGLQTFFENQPRFGPEGLSLIAFLRAPALAEPESLAGQLRYIRSRWGLVLTPFLDRLIVTLDVLHEEEVALWMRMHPTPGPGAPTHGPGLGGLENEYERFSADREWMPRVVLLAKTTYVWLDQLSKRYGRWIRRLDDIPDEELDTLARRGFTGLWLIGLWERSRASQRIKQWRGNPEAAASAYSLMAYDIAEELGGEEAFRNLRDRCWARGIRLSSDMVPNHMGIDSHWVIEHPDWFLQLPDPPYPAYTFSGGNVADDERVMIQIEDHYWSGTDAAVVFKRTDMWTGDARYIYHGNDGTSMPWNDTAQLDYLNPEVREAVIQTILHVARQFPIIRFDAAMTLARRHIQRLWYPEPGQGGAIPSRAEHAVPRDAFNAAMPNEFWREVVDRVAAEVPDTLLLAEAFWLLEGYFVRTLGMHRVYNSAFMNMLRDEENANYRRVMKDTLEFDPEVLKRFVNFMNNPDERTAVDQFGKGDKYFGVCTLLGTMPGLPMFGHGQIEGYDEKYGMEYRRAYHDETPDGWLVDRHEREIFPLLHRRYLFSGVTDFLLYDVYDPGGWVNEDVFAYSNRAGDERSLIVYHNRYAEAKGWVRQSAAYSVADGGGRRLVQRTLGEGLGLHPEDGWFTVLREQRSGLEFIRRSADLCREGFFVDLHAYGCQVFLDIRELPEREGGKLGRLAERLGGAGVVSIEGALRDMELEPLHNAVRALMPKLRTALEADKTAEKAASEDARGALEEVFRQLPNWGGRDTASATATFWREFEALRRLRGTDVPPRLAKHLAKPSTEAVLLAHLLHLAVADALWPEGGHESSLDELGLGSVVAHDFAKRAPDQDPWHLVAVVRMLSRIPGATAAPGTTPASESPATSKARPLDIAALLSQEAIGHFVDVNVWDEVAWFNREAYEELLTWLETLDALRDAADPKLTTSQLADRMRASEKRIAALSKAAETAGYQLGRLESATRGRAS